MRRVYDDTMYTVARHDILNALRTVNPAEISRYSYGCYRADASKIREALLKILNRGRQLYSFGRIDHAYGIGNNNASEIIYLNEDANEQQICGLFHCNEDMFSSAFCYVTDIDEYRKSEVLTIRGRG